MTLKLIFPSCLLIAWIGFCAYLSKNRCCGNELPEETIPLSSDRLSIQDRSTLVAKMETGFDFPAQRANLLHPISAQQLKTLRRLADYLATHPERRLTLTGYYTAQEKHRNADLGLARALLLKQELQHFGIPALQVATRQDMSSSQSDELPILKNAIRFDFEAMPAPQQLTQEMQTAINDQKVILHFDVAEGSIEPTPTQLAYFEQLQHCLTNYPTQSIKITGYTDDQGQPRQNVRLGRERALMVKNYLLDMGFSKEDLFTESAGERDPISSNTSAAGRAKNRRVEVELISAEISAR
ncbi:MAG: OmpA family protein [Bacteroidota bacterium]